MDYALEKEQSESESEYIEGPTADGYEIALYDVSGNNIILNDLPQLPSNLLHWQQDIEKHQEIWNVFAKLIPESQRNINIFYIITDGIDGISGAWKEMLMIYPNGIYSMTYLMHIRLKLLMIKK